MHVDYVDDNFQSVIPKVPKSQFDILECSIHQRRNPADSAPGKAQRHCHQPNEGADGRSQAAAAQ